MGKIVFKYCLHDEFKTIEPKKQQTTTRARSQIEEQQKKLEHTNCYQSFASFCLFYTKQKETKILTRSTQREREKNGKRTVPHKKQRTEGNDCVLYTYLSSGNVRRATFGHNENTIIADELWCHLKHCFAQETTIEIEKKSENGRRWWNEKEVEKIISNHLNDNSESTNDLFHSEIIKEPSTFWVQFYFFIILFPQVTLSSRQFTSSFRINIFPWPK